MIHAANVIGDVDNTATRYCSLRSRLGSSQPTSTGAVPTRRYLWSKDGEATWTLEATDKANVIENEIRVSAEISYLAESNLEQ